MKKCVIFGATGQDGVYLSRLLLAEGHHVIGVSRSSGGDIAQRAAVEALVRETQPDFIFHLAANSTTSHHALFENHETISTGTLNLLEAVRQYVPECRVFITGSGVQFVNREEPISERDEFAPSSAYAVARIQSAYAARYFRKLGVKAYVGYLFHHESPLRQPDHLSKKISNFARHIGQGGRGTLIIGDVSVKKEITFAGDVVAGIWALVNQDKVFEATIGSGIAHTVEEWLKVCFSKVGRDWREFVRVQDDGFVPEYAVLVSDPRTIFSLGWRPRVSVEALAEMMLAEGT